MRGMSKSARALSFEDAMRRLDEIVAALENGELGIEESIARYDEAMTLRAHCLRILEQAELRIQKIQDQAGRLVVSPVEQKDLAEGGPA